MKYKLKTRLRAPECIQKLQERTARPPLLGLSNPREETFFCRISGQRFTLYTLRPDSFRNTMMPFFFGVVEDAPDGAIVRGRLGVHPVPIFLLVIYLAVAASMTVHLAWAAVTGHGGFNVAPLYAILMPVFFGVMGVVVFLFGAKMGKRQGQAILRFLKSELEASGIDEGLGERQR